MTRNLRLATYNVEWFTELFDDGSGFRNDDAPSARFGVTRAQQFAAVGAVMRALDADAILVVEGPDHSAQRSALRALDRFAAHFGLRARQSLIGFTSHTQQEICLLYDPLALHARHAPMGLPEPGAAAPRFDYAYAYDLNGDGAAENIGFSKPPLEVLLKLADGTDMRLIGVHVKSKAPRNTANRAEFVAQSIANRRKQLAECFWLRGRVREVLALDMPLVVLGDFNDGPGLDDYERLFGYSSVEVVMGAAQPDTPQLFDPHVGPPAASKLATGAQKMPVTSRFYLAKEKGYFEALLDFIMVSPDIAQTAPRWRIWHPLHDAATRENPALAAALLAASDHFPVTIDINLPLPKAPA